MITSIICKNRPNSVTQFDLGGDSRGGQNNIIHRKPEASMIPSGVIRYLELFKIFRTYSKYLYKRHIY